MALQHDLRKAREAMKMSQAELARRSGLSRTLIHKAERGDNLTIDTLLKIAEQLPGLEVIDLGSKKLRFGVRQPPTQDVVTEHLLACANALAAASAAMTEAANRLAESTRLISPAPPSPPTQLEDWLPPEETLPPDLAERFQRADAAIDAGKPPVAPRK